MADYRRLYTLLFNKITDALEALDDERSELAAEILRDAQMIAEDMYIDDDAPEV